MLLCLFREAVMESIEGDSVELPIRRPQRNQSRRAFYKTAKMLGISYESARKSQNWRKAKGKSDVSSSSIPHIAPSGKTIVELHAFLADAM
jgi:hypothetical protein